MGDNVTILRMDGVLLLAVDHFDRTKVCMIGPEGTKELVNRVRGLDHQGGWIEWPGVCWHFLYQLLCGRVRLL